jgi:uncharacterized protein (DUF885 family)
LRKNGSCLVGGWYPVSLRGPGLLELAEDRLAEQLVIESEFLQPLERHRVVMSRAVRQSLAGVGQVLVNVEQCQGCQRAVVIFLAKSLQACAVKGDGGRRPGAA